MNNGKIDVSKRSTFVLVLALAALAVCFSRTAEAAYTNPPNVAHATSFQYTLHPILASDEQYRLGQEVRIHLQALQDHITVVRYLNQSGPGMRVRIAAAQYNRESPQSDTDPMIPCNSSLSTSFFETADLSYRSVPLNGDLVEEAYGTFIVPPYPWRICLYYKPHPDLADENWNYQWRAAEYPHSPVRYSVNESYVHFYGADVNTEGDFAAIGIVPRGDTNMGFPYEQTIANPATPEQGDNVKLVPAGYPCSYEKVFSKTDPFATWLDDYCGTNAVDASGNWIAAAADCVTEGSVTSGVAIMGLHNLNPFVDSFAAIATSRAVDAAAGERLVAYMRMPSSGTYDVCYSPKAYRVAMKNGGNAQAPDPLWFKLTSGSDCYSPDGSVDATCDSRTARISVGVAGANAPKWSIPDFPFASSWMDFKIRGFGLSSMPAVQWDTDCGGGCTPEYFNVENGDVLRLVPEAQMVDGTTPYTGGDLEAVIPEYGYARYQTTSQTSNFGLENTLISRHGEPSVGTLPSTATQGCWFRANDVYSTKFLVNNATNPCTTCDTDGSGATASGDLGGDPHRSVNAAYLDETSQYETHASIRIPSSGTFYVCYRRAGTNNWQALQWDVDVSQRGDTSTELFTVTPQLDNYNFTYELVNSNNQAKTWAQLVVNHPLDGLSTLDSTFYSASSTDDATVGTMVKLVKNTEACDTGDALGFTTEAGALECDPVTCVGQDVCTGCHGSKDESATATTDAVFHLRLPEDIAGYDYVRVCFKDKAGPWVELHSAQNDPLNPEQQLLAAETSLMTYQLDDDTERSWAKILFRKSAGFIDTQERNGAVGEIFHIVPNTTAGCDISWSGSGDTQYNVDYTNDNLGLWCEIEGVGACADAATSPKDGGVNGTYPYYLVNSQDDSTDQTTAVGFVYLPEASSTVSYRICYKSGTLNWFEVYPQITVSSVRPAQIDPVSLAQTFYAGEYTFIRVKAVAETDFIDLSTASLKLVPEANKCDRSPTGAQATGYNYISFTQATDVGGRLTDDADPSVTTGLVSSARAYFTFPLDATVTTMQVLRYRVCYAHTSNYSQNWLDFGLVNVQSLGLSYALDQQAYNSGSSQFTVVSAAGYELDRSASGDRFKLVSALAPCHGGNMTPSDVLSLHVGQELIADYRTTDEEKQLGGTNLGPDDNSTATTSMYNVTMPDATGAQTYRVCYKPSGLPWIELERADAADLIWGGQPVLMQTADTTITNLVLAADIRASIPTGSLQYFGNTYTDLVIAGVVTAFNTLSLGGADAFTYHLTVTGTGLSQTDELMLVRIDTETSEGVWSSAQAHTCFDTPMAEFTVSPTVDFTPTSATFIFTFPLNPGRFLVCYKKAAETTWVVPPVTASAGTNPVKTIASSVYISTTTTTLSMVDYTRVAGSHYASLSVDDRMYIAAGNAVCGTGLTFDGNPLTTAAPLEVGSAYNNVHASPYVYSQMSLTHSWYPITVDATYTGCYFKALENTTSADNAVIPYSRAGLWYAVPFYIPSGMVNQLVVTKTPVKLLSTCPAASLATGVPFSVTVDVADSTNTRVPIPITTALPIEVTMSSPSTGESFTFLNSGGSCPSDQAALYGIAGSNPTIATIDGEALYSVTPQSICSGGTCAIEFTSPDLTSSTSCSFTLQTDTVASVETTTAPTQCRVGAACATLFTALQADGTTTAYTANDAATVAVTSHDGLEVSLNGQVTTSLATSLTNGALSVSFRPQLASSPALWLSSSASYSVTVTVTVGGFDTTATISVPRPSLHTVAIRDLVMVDWDGSELNDAVTNQYSKWEPSATYPDAYWSPNASVSALSSVPDFPLQAGQFYRVTLAALDSFGDLLPHADLIDSSQSITIEFEDADTTNKILASVATATEAYYDQTTLGAQFFDSVEKSVTFRLLNSDGCTGASGCRLVFLFGGNALATPTYIETQVRVTPTQLRVTCDGAGAAAAGNFSSVCPLSYVEQGVQVLVEAVDPFGNLDPGFEGHIFAEVLDSNGGARSASTVSNLTQGHTSMIPVRAVNGRLLISDFTLSTPCDLCSVRFFSDFNLAEGMLSMSFNTSTVSMQCPIDVDRVQYYLMSSDRSSVTGFYDSSKWSQISSIAVYQDTDLCFVVDAVNADGQRTLYESIWVHYSVVSLTSLTVIANPSTLTPYRYSYMSNSRIAMCLTVSGNDGATFQVAFHAQQFGGSHWASAGLSGTCYTPTFTFTAKKFVGGLRMTRFEGMTVMSAPEYQTPGKHVWAYKQLTSVDETTDITVEFQIQDHYGKAVQPTNVHSTQTVAYATLGTCRSSDIDLNVCLDGDGDNNGRKIYINSPHRMEEGGMLRVSLLEKNYKVVSTGLKFKLSVARWCIKCDIPLNVYVGDEPLIDPVTNAAVAATISLSVLIPSATDKYVAFAKGQSPYKPSGDITSIDDFSTTWWKHWQPSASVTEQPSDRAQPIIFHETCVDGSGTNSCVPPDTLFADSICSASTQDVITGPNGGDLRLFVVHSVGALSFGEPVCDGGCSSHSGSIQSQVNVLDTYSVATTIGSQLLSCKDVACVNDLTTAPSRTVGQYGATLEAAILAAAAVTEFTTARFKLVGANASTSYPYDPLAWTVDVGSASSMQGVFQASSSGATSLTSVSGVNETEGNYKFVFRGPRKVYSLELLDQAKEETCVGTPLYRRYSTLSAYPSNLRLEQIAFDYTTTTIAVGAPFPITLELRDVRGELVTGAAGTVSVTKHTFAGCNNGGTITTHSSLSFSNGRATIWLSFSEPCQECYLRFVVAPSSSQDALYEPVRHSNFMLTRISKAIKVQGVLAGSSAHAFCTTDPTTQPAVVSVDDSIAVTVAAYAGLGQLGVPDLTAPIEVAAYNKIKSVPNMWLVGNGGLLRPSHLSINTLSRHNVRVVTEGSGTLSFAFQRTCKECEIVVKWHLFTTNVGGTFTLMNQLGTTFTVTGPMSQDMFIGHIPHVVPHTKTFVASIWSANYSSTIPFVGFDPLNLPEPATAPTLAVLDSKSGIGGTLTSRRFASDNARVYLLQAREPCVSCRLAFNSLTLDVIIRARASQLRIESLSPSIVSFDQDITISAYACDEFGFIDVFVGGNTNCAFQPIFACNPNGVTLELDPSQDGVRKGWFHPQQPFMSMGGPAYDSNGVVATTPNGAFYMQNGETPTGGIKFRVNTVPVMHCKPVITEPIAGVSSATYPEATSGFSVDLGLSDLTLFNDQPGVDIEVFKPLTILVGFTKQMTTPSGSSARFVAVKPDNTIKVTFSGECNVAIAGGSYYQKMVNGIANFTVIFTKRSVGLLCNLHFTNVAGSGQCTGGACSTTSEVKAFLLEATAWDFTRPSMIENGQLGLGPKYGSMGRAQVVQAQLYELTTTSKRLATFCSYIGCSLALTPYNCNPKPTVNPSGGAKFNENGTATIHVTWHEFRDTQQNNTIQPYSCTLLSSLTGGIIDGPAITELPVTVCQPHSLRFHPNSSTTAMKYGYLETGRTYEFEVGVYDEQGSLCIGDTQYDVSTTVTVSLMKADGSPAHNISAVNVNVSNVDPSVGNIGWNNTIFLAGGTFRFSVVITQSTVSLGAGPVRLRFRAFSTAPSIDMAVFSPPFESIFSSARLSMLPPLPFHVSRRKTYTFDVAETDLVPDTWLSAMKVPANPAEASTIPVVMEFTPSFREVVPIDFSSGARELNLVGGATRYVVQFTGADGHYSFYFRSPGSHLRPTPETHFRLETPTAIAIRTLEYRTGAPAHCLSDCTLHSSRFSHQVESGSEYLNTTSAKTFEVSVALVDADGFKMLSEPGLRVGVRVLQTGDTAVYIAQAPALVAKGPLYVDLIDGAANFSMGFVEDTLEAGSKTTHSMIRLEFFCASDECDSTWTTAKTLPIRVDGFDMTPDMERALIDAPVLKIPTTLQILTEFPLERFQNRILDVLTRNKFSYITAENLNTSVVTTVCSVFRLQFWFADLRNSVCGVNNNCSSYNETHERAAFCPPAVLHCLCPGTQLPMSYTAPSSRHFRRLQRNGVDLQIEVIVTLLHAPAFQRTSLDAILAEYKALKFTLMEALATQEFAEFRIVTDTILASSVLSQTVTAYETPVPTPAVPRTPTPSDSTKTNAASPKFVAPISTHFLALLFAFAFLFAFG